MDEVGFLYTLFRVESKCKKNFLWLSIKKICIFYNNRIIFIKLIIEPFETYIKY